MLISTRSLTRRAVGMAMALACLPLTGAGPVRAATPLLPDLQMAAPYNMSVQARPNSRKWLRFGTIVWNVGAGPLEIRGRDRTGNLMATVVQRIRTSDGGFVVHRPAAARVFYSGDGHDHWHVDGFIDVTLFPVPAAGEPVPGERPLRKIGFCLVDLVRAPAELRPSTAALRRSFGVSGCGDRASTRLRMGISSGWGDDYKPFFTHQFINVTDLVAGTYRLCATVNPDAIWQEQTDTANNTYWTDVALDPVAGTVSTVAEGATPCSAEPQLEPPPTPQGAD